ncbi:hypothetical protein HYU95_00430 [Candidatus Daviesbacteria bacterium]|nr:hypothetical protein [Candidatus Daviesbacteria bacterium]
MIVDKERIECMSLIVGQYIKLAGVIDEMFKVISPRVTYTNALWRLDGPFKDSGSCRDMDRYNSEMGITGIARDMLIQLREKCNLQVSGVSSVSDCPYHRCDGGCVLELV